ncbi:MAG TPA: hypothetical protein VF323_08690, partial [Candidatus Limnocylindrales bacterium]
PLVLLVVSVGEGPRHYIVQIGFLVALGATGWLRLVVGLFRRPSVRAFIVLAIAVVVAALLARPMLEAAFLHWRLPRVRVSRRLLVPLALIAVAVVVGWIRSWTPPRRQWLSPSRWSRPRWSRSLTGAALVLAVVTGAAVQIASAPIARAQIDTDVVRSTAVQRAVDWVRANVPPGSTVAFGSQLTVETALRLRGDVQTVLISDDMGIVVDPTTLLGIRAGGDPPAADWVALRASPTDVNLFFGYRAGSVVSDFRALGARFWVQTDVDQSISPIVQALRGATGVVLAGHWVTTRGSVRLETSIFKVDPGRLAFPDRVIVSQDALARIIAGFERAPAASVTAAGTLLARVTVIPDDARAAALVQRLRGLAAP